MCLAELFAELFEVWALIYNSLKYQHIADSDAPSEAAFNCRFGQRRPSAPLAMVWCIARQCTVRVVRSSAGAFQRPMHMASVKQQKCKMGLLMVSRGLCVTIATWYGQAGGGEQDRVRTNCLNLLESPAAESNVGALII